MYQMEEILETYKQIKQGFPNQDLFSYGNVMIHFSQNCLNVLDCKGEMPCGRYKLPVDEEALVTKLNELDGKIGEMMDNNQYICGKCGEIEDLPEFTRTKEGFFVCENCTNGGDIRKKTRPKTKLPNRDKDDYDPSVPSTRPKAKMTKEDAIKMLRDQGYVIKRLKKSFKVIYRNGNGVEQISAKYYSSKTDFENDCKGDKFVALVKELYTADEEPIDG